MFSLGCPYHECIGGGHDLDPIVVEMVQGKERRRTGALICHGWQDAERVGKHECPCHLDYEIEIDYRDGTK